MGQTKRIGIQVKNLYKMEVDRCAAMVGKEEKVVSQDEGKLWPSSPWHPENFAADFYWTSQGYTCVVRSVKGMYYGKVCKYHLS